MGAKRIAFLSGKDPGEKDRGAAVKALVKSVKELCAYGREKGIALTCETFDRDVDKRALIGPSALAAEFAAQVRADYPEFGLMYDLSHQPLLGEKSEDALRELKEYLVHIHVGNCVVTPGVPGYGDLHPRFGWPGGSNDVPELAEFIRALFKVGYLREGKKERPWVGFEVKPRLRSRPRAGHRRDQTRLARSLGAGLALRAVGGHPWLRPSKPLGCSKLSFRAFERLS